MTSGDVVLVKFPFANLADSKKRPALVLLRTPVSRGSQLVTVAMITSKIDGLSLDGDLKLRDWKDAKLLHPSLVRLSKIATLDSELVERKLGALTKHDCLKVGLVLQDLFSTWI